MAIDGPADPTRRGVPWPLRYLPAIAGIPLVSLVVAASGPFAYNGPVLLAGNPLANPANNSSANSSGPHVSAAACAILESNATLEAGIVNLYPGDGNATGSGSGLIDQSPPGPAAYPNESTAEAHVIAGWHAICFSAAYYAFTQPWGVSNNTWNALAQNGSGVYEFVFAVTWPANASSCPPTSDPVGPCTARETWLVNVASGGLTGPKTDYFQVHAAI